MTEFDTDRVGSLVQSVLASIVEAAQDLGVVLPTRQIAGAGTIPSDCEQVVASIIQVSTGAPEARSGTGTYPTPGANVTLYTATLQLAIVRNSSSGMSGTLGTAPPTADALLSNLTNCSGDIAVLITAANAIIEGGAAPTGATPRVATVGAPQGGLLATTLRLTITA